MSSYPANIRRCQHIKVNGTQCGSPALREEKCCYFHMRWRGGSKFAEGSPEAGDVRAADP